jgi:hypothetical protein
MDANMPIAPNIATLSHEASYVTPAPSISAVMFTKHIPPAINVMRWANISLSMFILDTPYIAKSDQKRKKNPILGMISVVD